MMIDNELFSYGEKIGFDLCGLYRGYGYLPYKMSKFEEYDLYADNKDFLISDQILTFTDLSGKLMALKPDVTLSIVRNSRDLSQGVKKLFYTENVYRAAKGSRCFQEILQAGLECLGEVDVYCISEVLTLAAESLRRISGDSVLVLSDLDLISTRLDALQLSVGVRQDVLRCISGKNMHELAAICAEAGVSSADASALEALVSLRGTPEEVLPKLRTLDWASDVTSQLSALCGGLSANGYGDMLRIDLSLVSDMTYYNGIVFQGFVSGVPSAVISGGQYDRLMRKMDRRAGAIGFAVYLDALERMQEIADRRDVDVLLLYGADASLPDITAAVQSLTAQGISVSAQRSVPEKLSYRHLARLQGSEVVFDETDA